MGVVIHKTKVGSSQICSW